jgi:drug/metabolite transporter (DMT)-like permease
VSPARGLFLFFLAALSFGLMAVAAKLATARLSGSEVAALRFLIMLAPVALVPSLGRRARRFQRLDLLLYRGVFGGVAVLLYFLAIEHLPVGTSTLLNYTSPVFAVLFASLLLGERIDPRLLVPLVAAVGGVLLVFHDRAGPQELFRFGRWEAVGLASAVLSGAAVTALRAARRTEGSLAIYSSFSLAGLAAAAPFAVSTWRTPTSEEWLLLAAVGITSIVAQLLMTYSYRWVTNLQAAVMAPVAVLVAAAFDTLVLAQPFGPASAAGTALTVGGVVTLAWLQRPPRAIE